VSNYKRKGSIKIKNGGGKRAIRAYRFFGVLKHERVTTEDGGNENLELHVGEVLTHTCPIYIIHKGFG
jgi:hypothetical protein